MTTKRKPLPHIPKLNIPKSVDYARQRAEPFELFETQSKSAPTSARNNIATHRSSKRPQRATRHAPVTDQQLVEWLKSSSFQFETQHAVVIDDDVENLPPATDRSALHTDRTHHRSKRHHHNDERHQHHRHSHRRHRHHHRNHRSHHNNNNTNYNDNKSKNQRSTFEFSSDDDDDSDEDWINEKIITSTTSTNNNNNNKKDTTKKNLIEALDQENIVVLGPKSISSVAACKRVSNKPLEPLVDNSADFFNTQKEKAVKSGIRFTINKKR